MNHQINHHFGAKIEKPNFPIFLKDSIFNLYTQSLQHKPTFQLMKIKDSYLGPKLNQKGQSQKNSGNRKSRRKIANLQKSGINFITENWVCLYAREMKWVGREMEK